MSKKRKIIIELIVALLIIVFILIFSIIHLKNKSVDSNSIDINVNETTGERDIIDDDGYKFFDNAVVICFKSDIEESKCKEIINEIDIEAIVNTSLADINIYRIVVSHSFTKFSEIEQYCKMLQEQYSEEIELVTPDMIFEGGPD